MAQEEESSRARRTVKIIVAWRVLIMKFGAVLIGASAALFAVTTAAHATDGFDPRSIYCEHDQSNDGGVQ